MIDPPINGCLFCVYGQFVYEELTDEEIAIRYKPENRFTKYPQKVKCDKFGLIMEREKCANRKTITNEQNVEKLIKNDVEFKKIYFKLNKK